MPSSKNGCCFFAVNKKGEGGGTGGGAKTDMEEYGLNWKWNKMQILNSCEADFIPKFGFGNCVWYLRAIIATN